MKNQSSFHESTSREKHVSGVLASCSLESLTQNPTTCATQVQTAAAKDLARMGLGMISFTIRNIRPV